MSADDGNGWVSCRCGEQHWGRHGAVGLVLLRPAGSEPAGVVPAAARTPRLLLQLRAEWTHLGGTWGVPGGARDSHEDAETAALREAAEEVGLKPGQVRLRGRCTGTDHGDWSYVYVLAEVIGGPEPSITSAETQRLAWTELGRVAELSLHPGLAADWPGLRSVLTRLLAPVPPAVGT